MNDYEQRKQDRIDRLREKADKARAQSDALWKESEVMASVIPVGQPIHGSTDQRYRDRMMGKMEKSFAAMDKAEYYERRAQAAEDNTAISSDDPEAIAKLTEKLEGLKKAREFMKAINAHYRYQEFHVVRTTRITGGLHSPYKGVILAAPQGAVKRSADRIFLQAAPLSGAVFICSY